MLSSQPRRSAGNEGFVRASIASQAVAASLLRMAESVPYRLRSEFPLLFGTTATTESLRVAFEHEDNEVAAHVMDEVQKLAFALFHLKVAHAKIRRNSKSVLLIVFFLVISHFSEQRARVGHGHRHRLRRCSH